MTPLVITVDDLDQEIGTMEKLEAHKSGVLHRAFSIFVLNRNNELLIHQRADSKYHGSGLWTNTCCSHPLPGELTADAAVRRLREEMGMKCELRKLFDFRYRTPVENGLIEHEFDHVYLGYSDAAPVPDSDEVKSWRWASIDELLADIQIRPAFYTKWFVIALPMVAERIQSFS